MLADSQFKVHSPSCGTLIAGAWHQQNEALDTPSIQNKALLNDPNAYKLKPISDLAPYVTNLGEQHPTP